MSWRHAAGAGGGPAIITPAGALVRYSVFRSPSGKPLRVSYGPCLGEGNLSVSRVAQRSALFIFVLTLVAGSTRFVTETRAAGAFAIGKCGAYGQAYDYPAESAARQAALKQCKGDCTAVTMKHACAAFAVDMANPCGPHGYAVRAKISNSLNEATRKCYKFGGKQFVIRA